MTLPRKMLRPCPMPRGRLLAAVLACCFAGPAAALPTGAQVAAGTASLAQTGNVLNVTNSNGAIINWQRFSIGANEATRFIQPSASSSVLNRVVGGDPSAIYGTLSSNGRVWLTNPAGILIGPGAHIDTAGLVASTLNIRNEDFLAGRLSFQATTGAGDITQQGAITTPAGGSVYVIGANVTNEGLITTPQGETILAAGQTVNLVDTATPGVKVEVTGAAGNATNLGRIVAEAGRIGIAGALVRNSGELNASSVVTDGGRIFLKASGDTYVEGGARIEATGARGGRIEVLGERVAVTGEARLDASGTNGGGSILVGGDYQGGNPDVQNAQITYFGQDTSLKADATGSGDGGKVIVWADDTTRAYGRISARGGERGGDGGFVEVSGKRNLDFAATVDAGAPRGQWGTLLLDPQNIVVATGGAAVYGDVDAFADQAGTTQTIAPADLNAVAANITLQATNDITFTDTLTLTTAGATLTAQAGNDIAVNNTISTNAGAVSFTANDNTGGTATGTGSVSVAGPITTGNGNVTIAGNAITFAAAGDITAGTGTVNLSSTGAGALTSIPAGTVISSADISIKTDQLSLVGTLTATSVASVTRYNAGKELQLGVAAADSVVANTLGIDDTELANITAGTYRFGDTTSEGGLRVTGAVSIPATKTLSLLTSTVSNSQIVQDAGSTISADYLRAEGTAVTLTQNGNTVGTLAGKSKGQNFSFKNAAALTIGTVDGQSGIDASQGPNNVTLTTTVGGITDATATNPILADGLTITAAGSVQLLGANSANTLAADVSSSTMASDIYFKNNKALSLGAITTYTSLGDVGLWLTAGNLTQTGVISATDLVVRAEQGDVTLTGANTVANVAAQIGTTSTYENKNFRVASTGALNVGTGLTSNGNFNTVSGITIERDAANFDSASPNGVIALTSSGALTQSAGATLSGKAVYAEGSKVSLTAASPTGVIAGKATGGASGDSFSYTTSSGISVTTVNGYSGILVNAAMPDTTSATLTAGASGIFQDSTAPISAPTGLVLSTTGPVDLSASNSVGALKALNVSSLSYNNSGALTIGVGADGISTTANGDITVTAGGQLSVTKGVNAGTGDVTFTAPNIQLGVAAGAGPTVAGGLVKLRAGQATTGAISTPATGTSASAVSGSEIVLEADNLSFAGLQPSFTGTSDIVYRTVSDNRAISTSSLTLSGATYTTPWLIIGNDEAADSDTAGAITVDDSINRGANGLVLLSGAGVSQNASKTITAGTLGVKAGGAVSLSQSNSVSTLAAYSGSGDITFSNAGALTLGIVNLTVPGETSALNLPGAVAPAGGVTVTAGGNITLSQYISALNTVTLNATGAGAIIDGNGSSTNVYALGFVANAVNGVGHGDEIETDVSYLEANNTGANNIQVSNTGELQILSGMSNTGGNISVSTTGSLTTGNSVISASGNVSLTAGGALTIGSGGVSAGGSIVLTGQTVGGNESSGGNVSVHTTGSSEPPPPTVVECEANPDLTGCAAVLPSLDTCTSAPTTAGCTAVLPSLDSCTSAPTTAGCTAVLPPLDSCTTTPTLAGCTAVLPSLDACTASPTTAGCTAVLPSVASCTTTPNLAGCTAVLPSLDACTSAPSTAGCSAVLPSVASCTTSPTLAGCTAVLPSLDACTTAPTTAGCTAVLPSLASCTTTPTLAGCTAVLPSLATCTANPAAVGCTAVLPSLASCATTPTLAGCTAVLPSLATCTVDPAAVGCTAVLPSLASCTTAPTTPGCSVVLPSLATCTTTPTLAGCSAVLPTVGQCVTNPAATGCSTVLPALAACTSAPTTPGCSVVLPSLDQCVSNPAAAGCSAVLPALADCTTNPALPGCAVVLPPVVEQPAVTAVVSTLETLTPQASQTTAEPSATLAAPPPPPAPVAAGPVLPTALRDHTTGGTVGQFGGSDQPAASASAQPAASGGTQPTASRGAQTTSSSTTDAKKEEDDKDEKKKASDSASGTKKDDKATAAKKPAQCN